MKAESSEGGKKQQKKTASGSRTITSSNPTVALIISLPHFLPLGKDSWNFELEHPNT